MSGFRSSERPKRDTSVTMRVTNEQSELLDKLAAGLETSKGEVLRIALDYWLENSPEAKRLLRRK